MSFYYFSVVPLDDVQGHFEWSSSRTSYRRMKRATAPSSVWPEILLLVDYGSFVLHGLSSRHIKRYFVSFWNGVSMPWWHYFSIPQWTKIFFRQFRDHSSVKSMHYSRMCPPLSRGAKYYDLSVIIMYTRPALRCYGQLLKITNF